MSRDDKFKKVISHAKEYGFIFQSSEIYDGLSAVYDYGQNGTDLKNNIKDYWLKSMVQLNDNIVNIDSAILMHPKIWKASGHVDAFNDPLIDNKDSKKRYRADVLIEEHISGKELTVSTLNFNRKIEALAVTEIKSKNIYFDYLAKYTKGYSKHILPAKLDKKIYSKCLKLAIKVHSLLNCRSIARTDLIYDTKKEKIY